MADRTQVFEEYFVSPLENGNGEASSASSEGLPKNGPREFSDYILLGKNGKAIAVTHSVSDIGPVPRRNTFPTLVGQDAIASRHIRISAL
ncbi:MAG TPA: hypothetical protein VMU57_16225 [Edaphobacter sp.]|uniref:hypothetical protein n=1 Tax=Edaphobacter sp. TaxID=1934404 RepID=UPI002C5B782E|nr:hypothetical protein [Edaphobacter sp.]HUZ96451.1 hypothetical protein [Edaphobacter sp.]